MDYEDIFVDTNLDFETLPINIRLVGVSFEDRQLIIPKLVVGQDILLIRDYNNKHDVNAIKVASKVDGDIVQIGWVPRDIASIIGPEIDSGVKWKGFIHEITGNDETLRGVLVKIYYN